MKAFSSKSSYQFTLSLEESSFEVPFLAAREELIISGGIKFQNADLYDRIPISFNLSLGHIDNPRSKSSAITVQSELRTIQIAEKIRNVIDADILLVINDCTTLQEIIHWKSIVAGIKRTVYIWNVSIYGGVTYNYSQFSFVEVFKKKVVIFLNNWFYRDDDSNWLNKEFHPIQYLEEYEIFEAARRHNVRTYIINRPGQPKNFDFLKHIVPSANMRSDPEHVSNRKGIYASANGGSIRRDEEVPETYIQANVK